MVESDPSHPAPSARGKVGIAACIAAGLLSGASAQPVELRQASEIGAGTAFRRGDQCLVLTAAHVVKNEGVDVAVTDRSGGRASGNVTYRNAAYDVAVVTLVARGTLACAQGWPESQWMKDHPWASGTQLEAVRHYPNGREARILLRWAGGTPDTLTLARVDRMEIGVSDSGAMVQMRERAAGIVKDVDTATDRVEVVRFDVIDRLVGRVFRGETSNAAVAFGGVFQRGRPNPKWSTYISAWLTESAQRPVVPAGAPQARCTLRAEVIDWSQANVPNPEYAAAQEAFKACAQNPLFRLSRPALQACQAHAKEAMAGTPHHLRKHSLQLNVEGTSRGGTAVSKLRRVEKVDAPEKGASRSDIELEVLQHAFATVVPEVFASAVCD